MHFRYRSPYIKHVLLTLTLLSLLLTFGGCGRADGVASTPDSRMGSSGAASGGSASGNSVPSTTCTSGSGATTAYVFPTTGSYDGNLGGRAGADTLCLTERTAVRSGLTCNRVKALVSINAGDEIRDLPNSCNGTLSPTTTIIARADGSNIAPSWNAFMSNSLGAGIISATEQGGFISLLWTGSTTAGALAGTNCNGFTSNDNSGFILGGVADSITDTTVSAYFSGGLTQRCDGTAPIFCICF